MTCQVSLILGSQIGDLTVFWRESPWATIVQLKCSLTLRASGKAYLVSEQRKSLYPN